MEFKQYLEYSLANRDKKTDALAYNVVFVRINC